MARVDIEKIGHLLSPGGWSKKGGRAAEYQVGGNHNYRTYKPTIAYKADGGVQIVTSLDHIRGGFLVVGAHDDHAVISLNFGPDGVIVDAKVDMIYQGKPAFNTDLIGPGLVAVGTPAGPAAAAAIIAKVGEEIVKAASGLGGGREIFPRVVELNINNFAASVSA